MNIPEPIKEFILKFFSLGIDKTGREEMDSRLLERFQAISLYFFFAFIFIFSTFAYLMLTDPDYLDGLRIGIGIFYLSVCVILPAYMAISRNLETSGTFVILFQYILFIVGVIYTKHEGFLFLFLSLIPCFVLYLKGAAKGLIWLTPFAFIYLVMIILADTGIFKTEYLVETLIYLFIGFVNLSIFAVISVRRIEKSTDIIMKQLNEITKTSKVDSLTSVLNKKTFMEFLDRERKRILRHSWWVAKSPGENPEKYRNDERIYGQTVGDMKNHFTSFSILVMDIDNFRIINDTYGYSFGDEILKAIGNELLSKRHLRGNDIIGRFGGEEFIVLLPETNAGQTFLVAERIRETISGIGFIHESSENISVTVSIGISEMNITDESGDDVIKRADRAMYGAKDAGRNCTIVYENISE